jgi:hypothetical protein
LDEPGVQVAGLDLGTAGASDWLIVYYGNHSGEKAWEVPVKAEL